MRLLGPGQQLGRYVVTGVRGIGSMGVVYAAHDSELDRPVALKLLRYDAAAGAAETGRARLVREAQALARLSHPHVVAIYDIGVHDDKVFAAMELVEGAALDEWLEAAPRTSDEIIDAMTGAGRGLAAAHAAGLVHRDVKPENILVGRDGRARMTDFGLVRVALAEEAPPAVAADDDSAGLADRPHLTRTGSLLGTPAYMSPEQLCAQPLGPKSDQFSFAVTLYEALYGARPFQGGSVAALRERMLGGALEVPRSATVPARVRSALRRALAAQPDRRFPSMDALLVEIDGERRRRRRARLLAGAAGAAALASVATMVIGATGTSDPRCGGAASELDGVWDAARRSAVERAFTAHGGPLAADAFERVARGLDAYTGAWVAMHGDACEASAIRGEQPADVLALRMACLGKDLELTRQLVNLFAAPGFADVAQAVSAVDKLPRLAECADIAALKAVIPLPADPVLRVRLAGLDVHVAELRARWLIDDTAAVRHGLPELVAEARRIGYAPTTARVLLLAGDVEATFGAASAAEDKLYEALWAAEAARDPEQVARAWLRITAVVGQQQRRFTEGDRLLRHAAQAIERVTAVSPATGNALRISLVSGTSGLLFVQGDHKGALARANEALALEVQQSGSDTVGAARLHKDLAVIKLTSADPAGAWTDIQRALAIGRQRLGVGPHLVDYHGLAAAILMAQGKVDDAIAEYHRALEIASQVFTADTSAVGLAVNSLALAYDAKGDLDRARPLLERGLAIWVKTRGPESSEVSATLSMLGTNAAHRGHWAAARSYFERALAISERADGPTHYKVAQHAVSLGEVLVKQGEHARARPLAERGVGLLEARRARGEKMYPSDLANARFVLAQALWIRPRERPRALALVKSARALLDPASPDPRGRAVRAELERWLAGHHASSGRT